MTVARFDSESSRRTIQKIEQAASDTCSGLINDDDMSNVRSSPDVFQRRLRGLSWCDCVASSARLSSAVFEECHFDRVLFRDCELSGASFVECRFRDCFILGGKAGTLLSIVDCSILDLSIAGLRADRVEVQGGTLKRLTVADSQLDQLVFSHVTAPRRSRGEIVMTCVNLGSVGGISKLAEGDVQVAVDADLWSLFGDLLLRQMGLERLDSIDTDEMVGGLRRR